MRSFDNQPIVSPASAWNERVLIAVVVVAMVLSLLGYMHA